MCHFFFFLLKSNTKARISCWLDHHPTTDRINNSILVEPQKGIPMAFSFIGDWNNFCCIISTVKACLSLCCKLIGFLRLHY